MIPLIQLVTNPACLSLIRIETWNAFWFKMGNPMEIKKKCGCQYIYDIKSKPSQYKLAAFVRLAFINIFIASGQLNGANRY